MDYVVGSVAALISGNVTPNRPRLIRRALTPTKHQPSPNVTPRSEAVDDRSIFLSPTLQKKKAIVKKSPKRIFQNPDLDTTENENDSSLVSPRAEKVKKHLKDQLEADSMPKKSPASTKSPKNKRDCTSEAEAIETKSIDNTILNPQLENESTPKKKRKKSESKSVISVNELNVAQTTETSEQKSENEASSHKSLKNMRKRRKSVSDDAQSVEADDKINAEPSESTEIAIISKSPKKNKKNKQITTADIDKNENSENKEQSGLPKKKSKKRKKKSKAQNQPVVSQDHETDKENQDATASTTSVTTEEKKPKKNKKNKSKAQSIPMDTHKNDPNEKKSKKSTINPNAITNKDSDSEHESDDEIESENEEINKKVLQTEPPESSSDEEEEKPKEPQKNAEKAVENDAEELKRTLFVGNVPFSTKCKKEIKKIFNKYGQIETIRIRTVPVADARTTPKLAVIKKELHPERSTVNVYIKYADPESVNKALSENNTVLNEHHLRVSRSDRTGAEHDPRLSVFVGNLPFALEDETLRAKFEKCGEIESVRIIRDKKTNAGKGFGYVNFKSKDGVELALELSEEDLTIKNRILRVKRCTQTAQKGRHQQPQRREFKKFNRDQGGKGDRSTGQGQKEDGAFRRILKKRKNQEDGDGPPNKRQNNLGQPVKEKKARKEFVGMTAEKKKKRKFDKGQKKKRALSEILTK